MSKTKYIVKLTTQFREDYRLAMKRGMKIEPLYEIVVQLAMGMTLPERNRVNEWTDNWVGHRACHIRPDWLLVYRIEDDVLILTLSRTESHSDLFDA